MWTEGLLTKRAASKLVISFVFICFWYRHHFIKRVYALYLRPENKCQFVLCVHMLAILNLDTIHWYNVCAMRIQLQRPLIPAQFSKKSLKHVDYGYTSIICQFWNVHVQHQVIMQHDSWWNSFLPIPFTVRISQPKSWFLTQVNFDSACCPKWVI